MTDQQEEKQSRHGLGDVWTVIGKQTEDIASVRTDVASLNVRVTHGFNGLESQLNALIERTSTRPNIAGWLSLAVSLALVMGAIGFANLHPVDARTVKNESDIDELSRSHWEHRGYSRGASEGQDHRLDRLEMDVIRHFDRLFSLSCGAQ